MLCSPTIISLMCLLLWPLPTWSPAHWQISQATVTKLATFSKRGWGEYLLSTLEKFSSSVVWVYICLCDMYYSQRHGRPRLLTFPLIFGFHRRKIIPLLSQSQLHTHQDPSVSCYTSRKPVFPQPYITMPGICWHHANEPSLSSFLPSAWPFPTENRVSWWSIMCSPSAFFLFYFIIN